MGRKPVAPPSKFWERLTDAFTTQKLPITQSGVARLLGMSQGSVERWYHGDGLPELKNCRTLALKGKVCVDWLITARKPKYPISKDPVLSKILEGCETLDEEGRKRILQAVRKELIQRAGQER